MQELIIKDPLDDVTVLQRLAFDVALCLEDSVASINDVLESHNLTKDDMLGIQKDPAFLRMVNDYRKEIREKGLTFKMKARVQAEQLLATSWSLIHSPDVAPSVKADLIKSTVRWGGLDISPNAQNNNVQAGQGYVININFGHTQERVIEHAD